MVLHGYAENNKHAPEITAKAGSDMDMNMNMESYTYIDYLANLVKEGKVSESLLDDAADRILRVKFELGLFDDPYKYCNAEREQKVFGHQDLHTASLDMTKKSMVLLKNEMQLLPLQKKGLQIVVTGNLADNKTSPLGSWRLAAEDNSVVSVLEAWHLGTQSGSTIARVLYGDYNPSRKLPMTFPKNLDQIPSYYNYKNTGRTVPAENYVNTVIWSNYGDVSNETLYPFGFGLSYTSFSYGNIKLSSNSFTKDKSLNISFTLTNTRKYNGKEVAQMYIRDLFSSVTRPVKELKGFELVSLKPRESKEVSFTIDAKTAAFYTANNTWEAEIGDFKVFIGGSSNTTLEAAFALKEFLK